MAYRLTPQQAAGIAAISAMCSEHDMPTYTEVIGSLAGLTVAVRDGKSTAAAMRRACATLERFRNASAERAPD